MTVLLDTHTLVWAGIAPSRIGPQASPILFDPQVTVLVSAATAWEIATKVRLGKLPEAVTLEGNFVEIVSSSGFTFLSISPEEALRAGRLPGAHRDPFDRMIAAQALARDIPVLSADASLDSFGILRIW